MIASVKISEMEHPNFFNIQPFHQSMPPLAHLPPQQAVQVANQKPKKVIYVDLKGNQKVYKANAEGGYEVDENDERNLHCEAVVPVLDVEGYDGVNYRPAIVGEVVPEQQASQLEVEELNGAEEIPNDDEVTVAEPLPEHQEQNSECFAEEDSERKLSVAIENA